MRDAPPFLREFYSLEGSPDASLCFIIELCKYQNEGSPIICLPGFMFII